MLAIGSLQCARRATLAAERPVRMFVTDARLDRFPVYAAAVRARQAVSPTLWLVTGDPFADNVLQAVSDGAAQVSILSRAGVDAVVLTPEWLSFGLPRLTEIVAKGRYYSLSASLLDESGQTIGHPFMVRKSGPSILAVAGIAMDSGTVLKHISGVRYATPDLAVGKAVALMRQRADLVGIMAEPHSSGLMWRADFTVNTSGSNGFEVNPSRDTTRINCYDISPDAGRLTRTTVSIGELKPDSSVARVLDSVMAGTDSLAAGIIVPPAVPWDPERLTGALIQGVLAAKLADGFLCDSLFISDFRAPDNVGALVALLRDAGRLAILTVPNDALSVWPQELVLRSGLSRSRLPRGQSSRIATTVEYLQRHPDLAKPGFELSARPFWTICRDILESRQGK
ncbi:hypothetical protein FJY68_04750 [candidate division WOR-3 bacterium]|uniref:Uncharacterized protein n=1 Tax=candidate division WOR-3 bacterium TaxID=2052148 RepID=A0A937XGE0_UNCW3|nr:hypothetical protein [candidate division WOR-3 bacterium]